MSKTQQLLIATIAINVILIGGYVFMFYTIKKNGEEASRLSNELRNQSASEEALATLRHAVNETRTDREKLDSHFVRSDNIKTFIESLESLGKESETNMKFSLTETKENSLAIDLRVTGTLEHVHYLIKLLEYSPYNIKFKKAYLNSLGVQEAPNPKGKTNPGMQQNPKEVEWDASFTLELLGYSKE